MDTNQWTREIEGLKPMGEIASSTCSRPVLERKVRPQKDQALNCPRCHSTNTKFCYYNNYSLTQPRYFCKTCRRYWTEGGTMRNVPVGGGSRKNKRSTTSTSSSASSSHKIPDLDPPNISQIASRNPNKIHQGQDLHLGFPAAQDYHRAVQFFEIPKIDSSSSTSNQLKCSSSSSSTSTSFAALELLRTGIVSRGMNSFITTPAPDLNALYTSGFSFQDLKPAAVSYSVDGVGSRFLPSGIQENGVGRLIFPFGAMKQLPSTSEVDQNKGQTNSNGYWNGMLGGGSW